MLNIADFLSFFKKSDRDLQKNGFDYAWESHTKGRTLESLYNESYPHTDAFDVGVRKYVAESGYNDY
jgi:hypothetical protein